MRYVVRYLLETVAGIEGLVFSDDAQEANGHNGPVLWYHHQPPALPDAMWVYPKNLLFETGVFSQEPGFGYHNRMPILFATPLLGHLPFDPFCAAFYMITRYEEYLPSIRDAHNRFDPRYSLAAQHGFLQTAVVNRWALFLKERLSETFHNLKWIEKKYSFVSTIDVDNAYAFKSKGRMRQIGAYARALLRLDVNDLSLRNRVFLGLSPDPYDTYAYMEAMHERYGLRPKFFFLFASYGPYDKNLPTHNPDFQKLILSIADSADVGIHPSYQSNRHPELLEDEVRELGKVIHRDVTSSRQHFLRLEFPATYKHLIDLDILEDHTMGFASDTGFRAGTCTPFPFYDLDLEMETKLMVVPFQAMDATLLYYLKLTPDEAILRCKQLVDEVRAVNGTFVSLWHNETLGNYLQWDGWRRVWEELLEYGHGSTPQPN